MLEMSSSDEVQADTQVPSSGAGSDARPNILFESLLYIFHWINEIRQIAIRVPRYHVALTRLKRTAPREVLNEMRRRPPLYHG